MPIAALGDVDKLLHNKMSTQHKALLESLAAGAEPGGVVVRNLARVRGLRGEGPAFWSLVGDIHTALGPGPGLVAVTELFASLSHHLDDKKLARWVRQHVVGPVEDRDTMGPATNVLNNKAGDAENLRLFGDNWRRTDLRGYMMANFGDSMRRLGRFDEMVAVAEFALSKLPHDHSIWLHRRNLAEAAMPCLAISPRLRELCVMQVRDHPGQRLVLHQLDLIAESALRGAGAVAPFRIPHRRLDERCGATTPPASTAPIDDALGPAWPGIVRRVPVAHHVALWRSGKPWSGAAVVCAIGDRSSPATRAPTHTDVQPNRRNRHGMGMSVFSDPKPRHDTGPPASHRARAPHARFHCWAHCSAHCSVRHSSPNSASALCRRARTSPTRSCTAISTAMATPMLWSGRAIG